MQVVNFVDCTKYIDMNIDNLSEQCYTISKQNAGNGCPKELFYGRE